MLYSFTWNLSCSLLSSSSFMFSSDSYRHLKADLCRRYVPDYCISYDGELFSIFLNLVMGKSNCSSSVSVSCLDESSLMSLKFALSIVLLNVVLPLCNCISLIEALNTYVCSMGWIYGASLCKFNISSIMLLLCVLCFYSNSDCSVRESVIIWYKMSYNKWFNLIKCMCCWVNSAKISFSYVLV